MYDGHMPSSPFNLVIFWNHRLLLSGRDLVCSALHGHCGDCQPWGDDDGDDGEGGGDDDDDDEGGGDDDDDDDEDGGGCNGE